ncbi:MAG: hypothetical protein ACYC8T_27520 [Myxococcaceae bacterium]
MPSRWDRILETRPVPILDHLLDEVARLVAKELAGWPLPFVELDPAAARQFEAVLAPGSPRPGDAVFTESFRLARWELERDTAAYDEYMRNRRWLAHGLAPADKEALLFVSRWLVEQLLCLGESTAGRVNRPKMLDCLDRLERRLAEDRA